MAPTVRQGRARTKKEYKKKSQPNDHRLWKASKQFFHYCNFSVRKKGGKKKLRMFDRGQGELNACRYNWWRCTKENEVNKLGTTTDWSNPILRRKERRGAEGGSINIESSSYKTRGERDRENKWKQIHDQLLWIENDIFGKSFGIISITKTVQKVILIAAPSPFTLSSLCHFDCCIEEGKTKGKERWQMSQLHER